MIKNLIFDFGNVVIRFDPYYMASCEAKNKEDIEILRSTVFNPVTFEKTDRGLISLEEHIEMVLPSVPEYLKENAINLLTYWYNLLPVTEGMEELIIDAKKAGYNIYLLSNINVHFQNNAHKVPILKYFDGTVFSSEIHYVKPEKEIYEYALEKFGIEREESVFIDDRLINVEGAENVGIKGYLFKDAKSLKDYINSDKDFLSKI